MFIVVLLSACAGAPEQPAADVLPEATTEAAPGAARAAQVLAQAQAVLAPLPDMPLLDGKPLRAELVELGRTLFYDPRLSPRQDRSCTSCHALDAWGVDGLPVPAGSVGSRNSPSVYNAALQSSLYWDGRALTIEALSAQALLNPHELGSPSTGRIELVLRSIPDYAPLFRSAFPDAEAPIRAENAALALAAFQRTLLNAAPIDHFLAGKLDAISAEQVEGLQLFIDLGCAGCHNGALLGGTRPERQSAEQVIKVPPLRNVDRTGPWMHDGSVGSLPEVLNLMAHNQLDRELDSAQLSSLQLFLETLTGDLPAHLTAAPTLPPSGPKTPRPDSK